MKRKEKYCMHKPCDSPDDCFPSERCKAGTCLTPRCDENNLGTLNSVCIYNFHLVIKYVN